MTVTIENTYTGNGSTTDYSFTFPYLDTPDIKVSLAGVNTTAYSLLNATTVRFDSAPGNGVAIRIYRETAYTNPKATFYPGSAIRAGDLNDNTLQNLYVNQESNDKVANAWLTGDPTVVSSETWYTTDDTKIASTKAIENRINSQIDSALTDDVVAGSSITIADNSPSSGKITVSVNASTTSASGSMSAADKSKLDGIESNATADQTNAEIRTAVEAATDSNVFTDADHTKLNGIETGATADQTNAEIRTAVEAASDSNVFTDADHTKLNGIEASATADQTAAEIKTAYESNAQTNPLTDAEKAVIDGVTANTSELNKLDGVTATTAQLNIVSGKTFRASGDGTLSTTSDTEIPSSKVIASHVASAVSNVGGFVTIANEISFPTTANQPANGVIVSISDAAGTVVNGSGVSTTGRTTDGTPATVTINNFPSSLNSETLASGVALLVTSTGSSNTYNYHKILAAETDVKSLSDDINDFNARYRVAGSAPGSNNDDGDLWFDTSANKMKVYNATGSSWDDVASVGQFFINTISSSSGTGGGSATFNGSAYRFTLSNPATGGAAQLLVSVNGVVQKPNAGSSQPSEGFAIDGNDIIFSAAPASGSDFYIVTQGSSVSIGTPSANSVNSSHIIDGSIVNADISNSAAIAKTKLAALDIVNADVNASAGIAGSKLADDSIAEGKLDVHNAPATDKYLKYTSNGMEWADGASEGTDVKSTGESGTTKFLRTDGDGTSSWQVPPDTVYTHPNHSGEVTSSADGAQTIASNVVDEDNLKVDNSPTNDHVLTAKSGAAGGLTWAAIPAGGNSIDLVADGAIAAGKPCIIKSNGKAEQIGESLAARSNTVVKGQAWAYNADTFISDDLSINAESVNCGTNLIFSFWFNDTDDYWKGNVTYIDDTSNENIKVKYATGTTYGDARANPAVSASRLEVKPALAYIGNNKVCIFFGGITDGDLDAVIATINPSTREVTFGTAVTVAEAYGNNTSYPASYPAVSWDSDNSRLLFSWSQHGLFINGEGKYISASESSGAITLLGSTTTFPKVSSNQDVSAISSVYDTNADRHVVVFNYDSYSDKGYAFSVETTGSTTTASSLFEFASGSMLLAMGLDVCFDSVNNRTIVRWAEASNAAGKVLGLVCNTSTGALTASGSVGNAATLVDSNFHSDMVFNPISGKAYNVIGHSSGNHWIVVYPISYNSSTGVYAHDTGQGVSYWATSEVRRYLNISSFGNSLGDMQILANRHWQTSGTNKTIGVVRAQTMVMQSNLAYQNQNFLGFAEDAISDGATGTIKLEGNVVGNQSGLTPATWYAVSSTGTLSSGGSAYSCGGLAVASDKLRIKDVQKN